ncbi:MAG: hypothetical protein MR227_00525 [Firmicutes bacterium]|nr:hypothetical protein [Bacillota bacterium]
MYKVSKSSKETKALIDTKKMRGFKVKPLNNVNYDGVKVDKLLIIKPSFVEKVLKRKTKRKLEMYLEFIINILESEDGNDSGKINIALNDLNRYKSIIKNNYRVYLDKLYYDTLMKKIDVIEKELKVRKMYLDMTYQAEIKEEKSRKSR